MRQQPSPDRPRFAIVGTRTAPAVGPGIAVYRWQSEGPWEEVGTQEAETPGYLAYDPDRRILYAAHGGESRVSAYSFSEDGELTPLGSQDTGGENPVHLTLSPSGGHVLTVNYNSGTVTVFPVAEDGTLEPASSRWTPEGEPGPHGYEQDGPKPHQVTFTPDGGTVVICDKGLDTLHFCTLDAETGELSLREQLRFREVSGPRHVAYHPTKPLAYCVDELSNSVSVIALTEEPEVRQYLPTLHEEDVRNSRAGGIAIDPAGTYLYVSNRSGTGDDSEPGPGPDSVAAFRVREDGLLEALGVVNALGQRPRFIGHEAGQLIVAHERSNLIQRWHITDDGLPADPETVAEVGAPMCVLFVA
ncbi:lactonase family protein [Corynebacterium halotolerans]|uniref:lactonase family protein n=1 Tax=Corynebacterium halotolerans TaxID=225326 RepID=UPI003CF52ED4